MTTIASCTCLRDIGATHLMHIFGRVSRHGLFKTPVTMAEIHSRPHVAALQAKDIHLLMPHTPSYKLSVTQPTPDTYACIASSCANTDKNTAIQRRAQVRGQVTILRGVLHRDCSPYR